MEQPRWYSGGMIHSSMRTRVAALVASILFGVGAPLAHGQSSPTALTYQGQLKSGGTPANGLHDFRIELYTDATAGLQLGVQCVDNVTVTDGLFTITLDFGSVYREGQQHWLKISARQDTGLTCSTAAGLIALTPRQPLTRTPLAVHATSASFLMAPDGLPFYAVAVDNAGNVGIGTVVPQGRFDVVGTSGQYVRVDSFGGLHMGSPSGTVNTITNDAPVNGITVFQVSGGNPLNLGPNSVGINGAAPSTSDALTVLGSTLLAGPLQVNGAITTNTQTRHISFHGTAFIPPEMGPESADFPGSVDVLTNGIRGTGFNGERYFMAPLNLPNGANITQIFASVVDNDVTDNILFQIGRTSMITGAVDVLAGAASGGNSTGLQLIGSTSIANSGVDNFSYAYWLRVRLQGDNATNEHRLVGARVTYTVTSPLP